MIFNFDKFTGKVKLDTLEKQEVIDLISLITEMKPSLPEVTDQEVSKLIDNINYYTSEDEKYKISVYFRESDVYHNQDGSITYGKFRSLFKVTIKKKGELKAGEIKDYIMLAINIIEDVYEDSKFILKMDNKKIKIDEFELIPDDNTINQVDLIVRII